MLHYVETTLRPYRFVANGQSWVDAQIEAAGIAETPLGSVKPIRGDIMALVARTSYAVALDEKSAVGQ